MRRSAADPEARLSAAELERALRQCDAAVRLVLPRILRRVIREHCRTGGWGWRVPHRKSYTVDRRSLLEIVEPIELGPDPPETLPEKVILLPLPASESLAERSAGEVLLQYWRLLLHAQVHRALQRREEEGGLTAADVRRRIERIGPTAFEEIRSVLQQEHFLLPPRDDRTVYVEFAAVYLEMRYFSPSFLPRYFPAIDGPRGIDAVLAEDLDAEALFRASRPAGAPDPVDVPEPEELDEWSDVPEPHEEPHGAAKEVSRDPSAAQYHRLTARAEQAAAAGNVVRSAIFRARAERVAPRKLLARARAAMKDDVDHLVHRLQAALELDDDGPQPWQESLAVLARRAPQGIWTAEARLLYDLQSVCIDGEREIHTVDLVEWILSRGHRPIQRPLPSQRDILMSKHLRSAARRLAVVRLSDHQRQHLSALIRGGIERAEQRIRERFRPQIAAALDAVGLVPPDLPERVARNKLIEEMLDRIVERGFLTMGDFRDALSRNNLKLPDLSARRQTTGTETPRAGRQRTIGRTVWDGLTFPFVWAYSWLAAFLGGEQLLGADRILAVSLDGVYRRGEIYLRWMQRFIALAFGTRTGRFLTRCVAVPFGGAWMALAFVDYVVEEVGGPELNLSNSTWVPVAGAFLLVLVNSEACRRVLRQGVKVAYRGLRTLLVEIPLRFFRLPWVRWILTSRPAVLAFRFLLKPAALTALLGPLVAGPARNWQSAAGRALMVFFLINLVWNSRAGRNVEEMIVDWTVQAWHRFGWRLLVNLFALVMDLFKEILETFERLLYTVDEWLRFKSGESRTMFWAKAVLGLIWFVATYVARFCVNLVLEPWFNPIKHFPVVTVSGKLIIPLGKPLGDILAVTMNSWTAYSLAGLIVFWVPGIFGFLVWELKENWRLYAANRPDRLRPVRIGSHGETMPRLLKRGLHSGTLPKRFAKLRRAERKARAGGNWKAVRKHVLALHHVELAVRRYVQRELLELLAGSEGWRQASLRVDEIRLGPGMIRVALAGPGNGEAPLSIAFEVRGGWLLAGVVRPGWAEQLEPGPKVLLANALCGLYKTAGVDLVHQQIEAALPPGCHWAISERGLIASSGDPPGAEVLYDLTEENAEIPPQALAGTPHQPPPIFRRSQLVFRELPVRWKQWVAIWELRPTLGTGGEPPTAPFAMLPGGPAPSEPRGVGHV